MGSARRGRRRPELPATIIRRIQSFLSPKLAIQSTLVSKSWRAAWSTRPSLVLDEYQFPERSSYSSKKLDPLVKFATSTFRTYEESEPTTRIETFRLCLKSQWYGHSGLANKWTLKALELGATDLTFRLSYGFYIPIDDIFGSQNVVSLCIENSNNIDRLKVIKCSGLKSLTLSNMELSTDSFFNIISCCPSIESLSLSYISTRHDEKTTMIGGGLRKLTSLLLHYVEFQFQTWFLDDMSSKFPNLKDLSLIVRLRSSEFDFFRKEKEQEIQIVISSPSLEILSFIYIEDDNDYYREDRDMSAMIKCDVSAEFDVPSIRKFTCEGKCMNPLYCKGKCIPNYMSFRSISRYLWESHISLTHHGELSTMWFCELRRFLEKLSPSKMHVYLHVDNKESFDYRKREIGSSNMLEVENLTINTNAFPLPTLSFQVLLDALFRMCRPKMITQCAIHPPANIYLGHESELFDHTENDAVLCRELIQGMKVKRFLIPSQFMYGLRDLEEVNVQKLSRGVWTSQPLDSILDDDIDPQRRIRLQLKWKQSTSYDYLPRVSFPLLIMSNADHEYSYDALPEAIIHRIQSFLSHKEAAKTALLSKSWFGAWSTRPTICLAQSRFPRGYDDLLDPLTMFATDTFRRYEESNLHIDTFRLCLSNYDHDLYSCSGLASEWISKALQMGATDLTLRFIHDDYDEDSIPIDKVFRVEKLISLRLHRFNIHRLHDQAIKCSGLKSLTLSSLKIPTDSFLYVVVSRCPLLQNLSLSDIDWNEYNCRKIKDDNHGDVRSIPIRLLKLTSLVLRRVGKINIEAFFLDDLSSKFPNLLTLSFEPRKYKGLISSHSVEVLYFKMPSATNYKYDIVEFDVPSIRKFTFEGSDMPKLSFTSTSCDQFESRVIVKHYGSEPSTEWLCALSKFLSQLRGSKIYLCLRVCYRESFDYRAGEIKGSNVCLVEDLTMDTEGLPSISFEALLDGVFRICRPMMITRYVKPLKDDDDDNDDDEKKLHHYDIRRHNKEPESIYDPKNTVNNDISLCEALEQGVLEVRSFSTTQLMYGLRELEEVNAQQLFDGVWMPQPFDSVLDSLLRYDKSVKNIDMIRCYPEHQVLDEFEYIFQKRSFSYASTLVTEVVLSRMLASSKPWPTIYLQVVLNYNNNLS